MKNRRLLNKSSRALKYRSNLFLGVLLYRIRAENGVGSDLWLGGAARFEEKEEEDEDKDADADILARYSLPLWRRGAWTTPSAVEQRKVCVLATQES
jgi:hypothetical protein